MDRVAVDEETYERIEELTELAPIREESVRQWVPCR